MTMIKKSEKADKKQLLIKLSAVIVALLLVFGVYSLMSSGDHESWVNKAQVRSSTNSKSVEVNSNPGDESEEGRLITFDLAKLKSGGKGTIKVRTRPSWAPIGVGQFHELVDAGFFDECRFFRVVKNFIVQFGINVSCLVFMISALTFRTHTIIGVTSYKLTADIHEHLGCFSLFHTHTHTLNLTLSLLSYLLIQG